MVVLVEVVNRLKSLHGRYRGKVGGSFTCRLELFDTPPLDRIEILHLALGIRPFPAPQVDADLHVLANLKIIQQIGPVLHEFHQQMLGILLVCGYDHIAFFKSVIAKGLGIADRFDLSLYFHEILVFL